MSHADSTRAQLEYLITPTAGMLVRPGARLHARLPAACGERRNVNPTHFARILQCGRREALACALSWRVYASVRSLGHAPRHVLQPTP